MFLILIFVVSVYSDDQCPTIEHRLKAFDTEQICAFVSTCCFPENNSNSVNMTSTSCCYIYASNHYTKITYSANRTLRCCGHNYNPKTIPYIIIVPCAIALVFMTLLIMFLIHKCRPQPVIEYKEPNKSEDSSSNDISSSSEDKSTSLDDVIF